MTLTPADPGYQVGALLGRVAELESRLSRLEWAHRVNAQKATVVSFIGGSSTCVVSFVATGTTASVPYPFPFYTPSAGHGGYVVDFGAGLLFIPVSAY